jgi:hypothetical protein
MDELPVEMTTALRRRLALAALSGLAALTLLLSVWWPLHTSQRAASVPTLAPTFTAVSLGPTPTPILVPTPLPVAGLLGAPPHDCPAAQPPHTLSLAALGGFSGPVEMIGGDPVWAVEGYFPAPVVDLNPVSSSVGWPSIMIMWEIGPHRYPEVTVRAFALGTGDTAWWGVGASNPQVPALALSPTTDFPTAIDWVPYRTLLFITHASCYEIQVSWAGGGWYTIFAAGQIGGA